MCDVTEGYGHLPQGALIALLEERDCEIQQQRSVIQTLTDQVENLRKEKDDILQNASIHLSGEGR